MGQVICVVWLKHSSFLNTKVILAQKSKDLDGVDAIVFPGQGSFDHCINSLEESGMDKALRAWILHDQPFFGICLGLQVLFGSSEEGKLPGLGIFNGSVVRFFSRFSIQGSSHGLEPSRMGISR